MREYDVRVALRARLQAEHENEVHQTLFVDELGLCGEARVDVAVVNGALSGYELKSARDNLDRLPNQVAIYGKVLDFAYLVVADTHLKRARNLLPWWWGILVATGTEGDVVINHQRMARPNPRVQPGALAQLLWRTEALQVLTRYGLDGGVRQRPRHVLWERLAICLDLEVLQAEVRQALKERRGWRESPAPRQSDVTSRLSTMSSGFLARRLR